MISVMRMARLVRCMLDKGQAAWGPFHSEKRGEGAGAASNWWPCTMSLADMRGDVSAPAGLLRLLLEWPAHRPSKAEAPDGRLKKVERVNRSAFYEITRLVAKMYGDNIRVAGRLPALFSRNQIALDSLVRKT